MVNWSRWARWSDTLTTLSAHTRAKRRSSWSFGAFQQPEPSLWQLGWCDRETFSGRVHKDIALFLEIKMDDSVNDKKYNYRQQAQLQKSWVRPTAIQSKSARRKPAGLGNKRQRTSVVLTRHSWTKQIHEIEGGLWTFGFHDILIMRWGTPKEKEENI